MLDLAAVDLGEIATALEDQQGADAERFLAEHPEPALP